MVTTYFYDGLNGLRLLFCQIFRSYCQMMIVKYLETTLKYVETVMCLMSPVIYVVGIYLYYYQL